MTLVIIFKIVKDGTSLQFTVSLINQTACTTSDDLLIYLTHKNTLKHVDEISNKQ